MAVGPENEAVVLAAVDGGICLSCHDLVVRKFDSRGAVDADFGVRSGIVVDDVQHPPEYANGRFVLHGAVAVQPDAKVLVAAGGTQGVTLVRLNPDGSLDPSFGTDGRVLTPLNGLATVSSVAVLGGGPIVVAGSVANSAGSDLFLARYTALGQLDPTFGTGGVKVTDLGGSDLPAGVALRDGRVLVGAPECCTGAGVPLAVAEFSATGDALPLFDGRTPPGLAGEVPTGISTLIARENGSLMVVGSGGEGAFVGSYLPNGNPDARFGEGGVAWIPSFTVEGSTGAVRDPQGGVVLVGWRPVSSRIFEGEDALTIRRVRPNGRLDPNFGGARPNLV
ncbi:MAG TPA: delta-60 repeat domain-containing protein, partial [Planctomycetaceae bacterium]